MSEPFIGEIRMVGFNFAPRDWAFCNGQLLSIAQNQALFSLLGTTYGGNGQTTFALPNLQGRVPLHMGAGVGLSSYIEGQTGGELFHTLQTTEIPAHTHSAIANSTSVDQASAVGHFWGNSQQSNYASVADSTMASGAVALNNGNQPHENRQPFLVINFVIALSGIFPSRN
jgi:microcystin-dependent protein